MNWLIGRLLEGVKMGEPKARRTGSKKTGCEFELIGKYERSCGGWKLRVVNNEHNHQGAEQLGGHPYAMRLNESETRLVEQLSNQNMLPRDILAVVKDQNPDNVSNLRNIYNARRKLRVGQNTGETAIQATGAITCGSFITRIARRIGRFSADIRDSMTVTYPSTLLGRNTVMLMGIAADLPRVGLRWSLDRRTEWVPPVPAPQQQPGAQPHVQEPPADQDPADKQPPPPPPAHHVVVRQPRLHPADAAILRDLIGSVRDLSGRVDRLEEMMRWMMERMAASAGMDVPVFPGPGHHRDPQDPGGHA
ncbi:hypothetical protein E3N88_22825 [Mikania micrantha]|uniref:FAR1 domain-containing protein n=1 Tax=Mikania micrantha TaxID=192012 RepID=A0A5N6NBS4_9ASTR|nr:hypothetical protein E3N88_22825 [Mikania micrantha]